MSLWHAWDIGCLYLWRPTFISIYTLSFLSQVVSGVNNSLSRSDASSLFVEKELLGLFVRNVIPLHSNQLPVHSWYTLMLSGRGTFARDMISSAIGFDP
jgi:hypothetical protein